MGLLDRLAVRCNVVIVDGNDEDIVGSTVVIIVSSAVGSIVGLNVAGDMVRSADGTNVFLYDVLGLSKKIFAYEIDLWMAFLPRIDVGILFNMLLVTFSATTSCIKSIASTDTKLKEDI